MSGRRSLDARLRWSRDARRSNQNSGAQGPRLKFYSVYDREAKVFDYKFADDCQTDLSDVLIFAGLLSTVNSFLAIQASQYATRDTGLETADFLRAILYTLNSSTIPEGDDIYVPPIWSGPTRSQHIASDLLYASFLLTIFASFLATLAKQWLVWYLKNSGTSIAERCRERQRKRDGFDRWLFQTFIDGLPLLLQVSLALLGAGLIAFLTTYSLTSAKVVIAFTALGVGTYITFTVPGTFSRYSPFQTPMSTYVRASLGNILLYFPSKKDNFINVRKKLSRWIHLSGLQRSLPFSVQEVDLYLGNLNTPNADDAHCVSWILKNINNPEAIDEALRLAGAVRWFEGGCNSDPPYDYIVSIFKSCFDFTGSLDKKSEDRAFNSATAILQVHISALLHASDEHASKYPIPRVTTDRSEMNGDLKSVLDLLASVDGGPSSLLPFAEDPKRALWTSELLLWHTTNKRSDIATYSSLIRRGDVMHYAWWHKFSPEVVKNFLLVWCVYLDWEFGGKTLGIQKFDSTEEILEQLSDLVLEAIPSYDPRHSSFSHLLDGLTKWHDRPLSLAHMAFDWCIAICEKIKDDDHCSSLIFPALQVGFRHPTPDFTQLVLHNVPSGHQRMVELVFGRGDHEKVADALCAWISVEDDSCRVRLLDPCVEFLVDLHADVKFSRRLRRAITHMITLIDFVERVGVERFTGFLVRLRVKIDDIERDARDRWTWLILRVIASEVGREHLPLRYWKLLVELVGRTSSELSELHNSAMLDLLVEKEEWEKLVCWLGVLWGTRPPRAGSLRVEVVTNATATLTDRFPAAAQRLRELVVDSVDGSFGRIHEEPFEHICGQGSGTTEQKLVTPQTAELSAGTQASYPAPSRVIRSPRTNNSQRASRSHRAHNSHHTTSAHRANRSHLANRPRPATHPDRAPPPDPDSPDEGQSDQSQDSDSSPPESQPASPTLSQSPSLSSLRSPSPTLSQFSDDGT